MRGTQGIIDNIKRSLTQQESQGNPSNPAETTLFLGNQVSSTGQGAEDSQLGRKPTSQISPPILLLTSVTFLFNKLRQLPHWVWICLGLIGAFGLGLLLRPLLPPGSSNGSLRKDPSQMRVLRVGGNRTTPSDEIIEIHPLTNCPREDPPSDSPIIPPPIPVPLKGIFSEAIPGGLLLCGGTDEKDHDGTTCYIWKFGSKYWEHKPALHLNTPRKFACVTREGDDIVVRGGINYDHPNCQKSVERLNVNDLDAGWLPEELQEVTVSDCQAMICFDPDTTQIPCG